MGAEVWRNFSIGVDGQMLTLRKGRSNRGAVAAPRATWESVHRTTEMRRRSVGRRGGGNRCTIPTLATLDEQSWAQVGTQKSVQPPRPESPTPPSSKFPLARPGGVAREGV